MLTNKTGTRIPDITLPVRDGASWKKLSTAEYFKGRTIVVFALPGAFTPTCSSSHVPRYVELFDAFRAVGVDDIACISVNDTFVMNAWQDEQGAESLTFLPDGNGQLTEALGMLVDKADLGFGKRSWRYAMVVKDGVIDQMFIEPEVPGDPYGASDADSVLKALGGKASDDVVLFTKPGCSHCARAKSLLAEQGVAYDELPTSPRILAALPGEGTTPQVFINGSHIGGADQLEAYLQGRSAA